MTSSGFTDAAGALWKRGAAKLSGGAYTWVNPRSPGTATGTNIVHERNLSRYSSYKGVRDGTMAMGIVQASLAIANGLVQALSCEGDGRCGRLTICSSSGPDTYDLTWDDRDPTCIVVGGLPAPRYQVAVAGFALLWCQWTLRLHGHTQADEVMERWDALLHALASGYPPDRSTGAWSLAQLAAACADRPRNGAIRDAMEGLADALWLALAYRLPDTGHKIALLCRPDAGLDAHEGYTVPLAPRDLLRPRHAGTAAPTPVEVAPDADHDLDLDDEAARAVAAAEEALGITPGGPVATEAAALVRLAYAGEGAILLCGLPGQGKTLWAKRVALEWGDGFELVELSESIQEADLYGVYVPGADGRLRWEDGPVTRWARRIAAGGRMALLLDELPRGHRSLVAGVMKLINTHDAVDVTAQGLCVPAESGPYHILRVEGAGETLVLPDARLKVVATANLGERYQGMDLSDPALLDRWAYFIELGSPSEEQLRAILSHHTRMAPAHPLFDALLAVEREVRALDRTAGLRTRVTLRTLLRWALGVVALSGAAAAHGPRGAGKRTAGPGVADAFVRVARVQWLDKVTPLNGDEKDPDIAARLLTIVERHAPDIPL